MQNGLQAEPVINLKHTAVNILLVATSLFWYIYFFSFLKNNLVLTGNNLTIIFGLNLLTVISFAVLSTKLIQKIKKRLKFITYWLTAGILISPIMLLINDGSFFSIAVISGAIGAYFGFGFPVLLGYYSATTARVYRARISGLAIFFTCALFVLMTILVTSSLFVVVALMLWKVCGLFTILLLKPSEAAITINEKVSYKTILKTRSILLYFIPWVLFFLVNSLAFSVLYTTFDNSFVNSIFIFETAVVGVSAFFFGFFADRFGRKRLLILGFVLFGLGYALLGLFPTYDRGLLFYMVADGLAWGIFLTLFLLTLWGDIARRQDSEKFFVIGFLPYLFSNFLQVLFGNYIVNSMTDLSMVFSFSCFFLFITAIPLFLAPETLSERDLYDANLKDYLAKAQTRIKENAKKPVEKID
jgi:hypothetical protein